MAVELEVTFRGMFILAMPPVGSRDHARILMPRNDIPRVAQGNDRYTIPAYESYIAIPTSANPTGQPDLTCYLPVEHGEVFNTKSAASEEAPQFEAVSRAMRREGVLVEQEKEPYAIYYTGGYEIVVHPLSSALNQLRYDSTPVADNQQPGAGEQSVNWLAQMRADTPNPDIAAALLADVPPATASFIDLSRGTMRPRGLLSHHWRYLHLSTDTLLRPFAQELLVTAEVDAMVAITLRPIGGGADVRITFTPAAGDRVIIGSEPLDDILGTASVHSCVEPAYDFELQYDLVGGSRSVRPVPLCSDNLDHRSPPSGACGPPVTPGP
jgi:hypothetical protein